MTWLWRSRFTILDDWLISGRLNLDSFVCQLSYFPFILVDIRLYYLLFEMVV